MLEGEIQIEEGGGGVNVPSTSGYFVKNDCESRAGLITKNGFNYNGRSSSKKGRKNRRL